MEPLLEIRGPAAPLPLDDINTDMIAPTRPRAHLSNTKISEREFEAAALFAPLRYDASGAENPSFVLNQPGFRAARILLSGRNFGCGSSREQAVWLLADFGIRCIIAQSYGGIFYDSCFKNGILPVILPTNTLNDLMQEAATGGSEHDFTVSVAERSIVLPSGRAIKFDLPEFRRAALMSGVDDIDMTLSRNTEIAAFVDRDRAARPWIYLAQQRSV